MAGFLFLVHSMKKTKSACDTDDSWSPYQGGRCSIEVYASETSPHPLGFDLRPRKERMEEKRKAMQKHK